MGILGTAFAGRAATAGVGIHTIASPPDGGDRTGHRSAGHIDTVRATPGAATADGARFGVSAHVAYRGEGQGQGPGQAKKRGPDRGTWFPYASAPTTGRDTAGHGNTSPGPIVAQTQTQTQAQVQAQAQVLAAAGRS